MNLDTFIASRQPAWRRMEALLDRASRDIASLSAPELDELGRLYRQATSDLAVTQRDYPHQRVAVYLDQLVGRAHALLYREEPLRWRRLAHYYAATFPLRYQQLLPYTALAFLFFLLPAVAAFLTVWRQPEAIYTLIGPQVEGMVRQVEQGQLWTDIPAAARSTASATILTNNIQVMFLTFAGGATAGLLTILVLLLNGVQIGAIFGLLQAHGLSAGLAEFVAAHGPIELSVIYLAGGCGLYMGDGLLRPGLLSRREALVQRTRAAVQMILACVPLLILAGLIEGFVSPSALPWWLKVLVGLITGLALYAYWLWPRAERKRET